MKGLPEIINYYRLQPHGFFVCGVDYGYGDSYQEAQSPNGDKILELWKMSSDWNWMVNDFRGYLTSKYAEHDDDNKPMLDNFEVSGVEYSVGISITIQPEFTSYFQSKGYDFDDTDNYSINFSMNNEGDSIENNAKNIKLIEKYILSSPAHCFKYINMDIYEFYFSQFDTPEELSSKIESAWIDNND
jgi:hypothetical protein